MRRSPYSCAKRSVLISTQTFLSRLNELIRKSDFTFRNTENYKCYFVHFKTKVWERKWSRMPIYYSLIARDTTVLVDHSENTGNFPQIAQTILAKVPREDTKCTYISGRYIQLLYLFILNVYSVGSVDCLTRFHERCPKI